MRKKILLLLLLLVIVATSFASLKTCMDDDTSRDISTEVFSNASTSRIDLGNIQERVADSLTFSIVQKKLNPLNNVYKEFSRAKTPLEKYWKAYICYQRAIYGIIQNQSEIIPDKTIIKENVEEGIEILKNDSRSSESYALLGTLTSLSIDLQKSVKRMIAAKSATKHFNKSLELNKNNLRAYLGLASLDYYTPKKYGGGKKVNGLLEKGLACNDKTMQSPVMPSWGRIDIYVLLIDHNLKEQNVDLAKKYFREAITKFPDEYRINQLAKKFI